MMGAQIFFNDTATTETLMSVRSEFSGPYAIRFPAFEHAKFVSVLRGRFDLQIDGELRPTKIRRGDCYILTSGKPYRISNADVPVLDAVKLFTAPRRKDGVVRWGNGIPDTITIGCRATLNPDALKWLRETLPPLIRLPAGTVEASCVRAILKLILGEPDGALGATLVANKYVALILVHVARRLQGTLRH